MTTWSASFEEAVFTAHFRAMVTRLRYRVTFDRANRLWDIRETTVRVDR